MHVYFVRHGSTRENEHRRHQSPSTPLSLLGIDQARTVAEDLRSVNPDLILTSPYIRAKETAGIISRTLEVPVKVEMNLREVMRPSVLYGKHHYNLDTLVYMLLSFLKRNDPDYKYFDGENFSELLNRIDEFITTIEGYSEKHDSLIVVSHTVLINMILLRLCHREHISRSLLYRAYISILRLKNGKIVHSEYLYQKEATPSTCTWIYHGTM